MFSRTRATMLAAVITMVATPSARAQGQHAVASGDAGPRIELTANAMRATAPDAPSVNVATAAARTSGGKPVTLMIVGGAAIVLGAVIGDTPGTLFMVGGAVALLYGLYHYLQ